MNNSPVDKLYVKNKNPASLKSNELVNNKTLNSRPILYICEQYINRKYGI